jgi:DNA-binding transcriptional MerR regulator
MDKSPDAFRTISEVADWLGVQAHVLRFWESKFAQVKPVKRAGGRRYYRPGDMLLLGGIKRLLHDDGLTIKGVQKTLREQGVAHVSDLSPSLSETAEDAALKVVSDAKVLPFKGTPTPPAKTSQPSEPEPEPEAVKAASEPEPQPVVAPAQTPAEPEAATPPPVEGQPILPSFLHRPAPATPRKAAVESDTEPVAEAKPSLVVEAPDPPDESELPYTRGALAHLAGIKRLGAGDAAKITPLAKELQAWLDRAGGAGAA